MEPNEEVNEEISGLGLNSLRIETAVTEAEAEEGLEAALGMEVEGDRGSEGEEEGGGNLRALEALDFLTQEVEPSGTTLVDAHNGFNELSRLAMLWTVCHRCPAGARFAFNCYKHWAQLLLCQPGGGAIDNPEQRGSHPG